MKNKSTEPKSLRFLWGGLAFGIYLGLIILLIYYFNQHSETNPKHFVKKDEKRVQVMDAAPIQAIKIKTIVEKPKPEKVMSKKVEVIKPLKSKVPPKKEKVIVKEKIVKKKVIMKKDENLTKPKVKVKKEVKKPKKTSDLFSSVKTTKKEPEVMKNKIQVTDKPQNSSEVTNSVKLSDSGMENAYFAKVQSLLETWPAQSDYAGEKAMVNIYVKPTGMFEFKVKSQSDNVDFNLGLIDFLMQLQRMGLGSHEAGKTYEIQVEFTAKE